MITKSVKPADVKRRWVLFDAAGVPLGRLAIEVAKYLRGKYKPDFTPHVDCGDFVIVTNASQVVMTGNKGEERIYRHTGYPGGIRSRTRSEFLAKFPDRAVERTIKGMLPHTKLGDAIGRKLKVYAGAEHPHEAQQPEKIEL
ncbi:MAG: 50S ribosomal protein L13 [Armatimonadetes bacterium]|nr:50S ribosomal protein L13 [Armatimonadota bacterium]